jgi:hypothetical protein
LPVRHRLTLSAVVVLVVVGVVLAVALPSWLSQHTGAAEGGTAGGSGTGSAAGGGSGASGGGSSGSVGSDRSFAAPAGTRWVGAGRLVVAVPSSWGTDETQCGTPVRDTVVFEYGVQPMCAMRLVPPVSSLHIAPPARSPGLLQPGSRHRTRVPGGEVFTSGIMQIGGLSQGSPKIWQAALQDPRRADALMWVVSPQRSVVAQVLGSARFVPQGWTTVPPDTAPFGMAVGGRVAQLRQAGLKPVVQRVDRNGWAPGSVIAIRARLGEPVPVGTRVVVVVQRGTPALGGLVPHAGSGSGTRSGTVVPPAHGPAVHGGPRTW